MQEKKNQKNNMGNKQGKSKQRKEEAKPKPIAKDGSLVCSGDICGIAIATGKVIDPLMNLLKGYLTKACQVARLSALPVMIGLSFFFVALGLYFDLSAIKKIHTELKEIPIDVATKLHQQLPAVLDKANSLLNALLVDLDPDRVREEDFPILQHRIEQIQDLIDTAIVILEGIQAIVRKVERKQQELKYKLAIHGVMCLITAIGTILAGPLPLILFSAVGVSIELGILGWSAYELHKAYKIREQIKDAIPKDLTLLIDRLKTLRTTLESLKNESNDEGKKETVRQELQRIIDDLNNLEREQICLLGDIDFLRITFY
eukprot:TRINITY_DN16848_c0_g1_i1.p1 TRINITY_DN16848_c0_g1~~TRINITY_DN16848_c0_g1_i1.p1  ORF type:complete len:316 (-),score=20.72 TRINITY_DN16848_c0_g1_i1:13-960(-)